MAPRSAERFRPSGWLRSYLKRKATAGALLTLLLLLTVHCAQFTAYGASWTRQPSGTMAWLHAVYFLDQNHGWIAGGNGTLLSTVDGGVTWNKNSLGNKDTLTDVYFADSTEGW